jgi:hypothetical protein
MISYCINVSIKIILSSLTLHFNIGKMIPKHLGKLGVSISEALLVELKKRRYSCFINQSITLLVSNVNTGTRSRILQIVDNVTNQYINVVVGIMIEQEE